MAYFTQHDHNSLLGIHTLNQVETTGLERVHRRMFDLHRKLYPCLRTHDLDLQPHDETALVSQNSSSTPFPTDAMTLIYRRGDNEARVVERMMGRDALMSGIDIEAHRHPVLELRLTPQHFAIELVAGPDAWYDQENFIGKMSVDQHRAKFYNLLTELGDDYVLGFWSGMHLDDMHLKTEKLPPARILFEFINTFAAGRDYLRIGRWYESGDGALDASNIANEVLGSIRKLYSLYQFAAWATDNNFHSIYKKAVSK